MINGNEKTLLSIQFYYIFPLVARFYVIQGVGLARFKITNKCLWDAKFIQVLISTFSVWLWICPFVILIKYYIKFYLVWFSIYFTINLLQVSPHHCIGIYLVHIRVIRRYVKVVHGNELPRPLTYVHLLEA